MLHSGLTQEWVGVGELPKERTQSEMAESLQCTGRGHKWRDRSMSSSHKNLNAMEMLRGGDMKSREDVIMQRFDQELLGAPLR
ncbi:hypothetical protein BHM03_00016620 [Ensete ventricosum]|nr:hypothetical protein BHM03_00016620 [Ensete ventricosum]